MSRNFRDFNRLDPRLFKAFLAASEYENFTIAAKQVGSTQSGISQQVAKLEEQIGMKLFKRINKAVVLTEVGSRLVHYIDKYLDGMDEFFEDVFDSSEELKGKVSYSMPNSCLLSPHLGMMLEKRKESPGIELDIKINPNKRVYEGILNGEFDFGFVTEKEDNPALKIWPFCKEEFVLIGAPNFKNKEISLDFLKEAPFITYPGFEAYFEAWKKNNFLRSKNFNHHNLNIKAKISQLDGVITFVRSGTGISIIPKHCVMDYIEQKEITVLQKGLKKKDVLNQIYIIHLADAELPRRCQKVIDWFFEMKG